MEDEECQAVRAWTRMGEGGRLVVPAEMRQALGLKPGDKVLLELTGDELRVLSLHASIRRAQEIVRRYVPEGVSLVDELIAERRAEAAAEEREASRNG